MSRPSLLDFLKDEFRELCMQGLSDHDISTKLGVGESTIGDWRKRLNLKSGYTIAMTIKKDIAFRMWCQRHTIVAISKALLVSQKTISKWVHELKGS